MALPQRTRFVDALLLVALLAGAGFVGVRLQPWKSIASAHYSVQINGGMPKAQTSGVPMELVFTVRNTGSAISDYAVQFDGLDQWIMDDVSAGSDPGIIAVGPDYGYAFGPLAADASMTITLDLAPRKVGRPTLSMTSYSNLDATKRQVPVNAPIGNGGATWSAVVNL